MRLALLPAGSILLDKGRIVTPGVDEGVRIVVPVWSALIETDDRRRILVDTGMHPDHIANPRATHGDTPAAARMTPRMTYADLLPNRLQSLGVPTNVVSTVILSHLHWDHCGQTRLFEGATVYVRRDCLEAQGRAANPRIAARDFLYPAASYAYLPDEEIGTFAPGVEVIHTPGHAMGHVSLLVTLRDTGPVLLPIDALPLREHVEGTSPGAGPDMEAWHASRDRLLRLAAERGATMFLSHDIAEWERLRHAPQWYT